MRTVDDSDKDLTFTFILRRSLRGPITACPLPIYKPNKRTMQTKAYWFPSCFGFAGPIRSLETLEEDVSLSPQPSTN